MSKCKKHPQYKVIRKPTADCEQCRKMWADKQEAITSDKTNINH